MCYVLRCSLQLAMELKKFGFRQHSLYLDCKYYVLDNIILNGKSYIAGDYIYCNNISDIDMDKLVFIPYYAEVYDWFDTEKDISIAVWRSNENYTFAIYDLSKEINEGNTTLSVICDDDSITNPIEINEIAITAAMDYINRKA